MSKTLLTLKRLAWIEMLGWARRRWSYVVLIGVVAVISVSAVVGVNDLSSRRAAYGDQLAIIAQEQVKPRLPMSGTTVERVLRVPRPPELGSIVARGDDVRLSPYFDFGPGGLLWGQSVVTDTAQMQAGALFDVESILRVIGGLIALLLGIEVVGQSRFRGQLRAWQALGVNPLVGVAGKLLGCAVLVIAGCVVVLATILLVVSLRLPDDVRRSALIVAGSLVPTAIYLWVLMAAGAALALWSRTMVGASVAGVVVWIAVAMIGPQVTGLVGLLLSPNTPRAEYERARDQLYSENVRAAENALGEALDGVLDKSAPRIEPLAFDAAVLAHKEDLESIWMTHVRATRQVASQAEDQWMRRRIRQLTLERWFQAVTPGACLVGSVTALAGTGPSLSVAWYDHVLAHQRRLTEALFDNRSLATVRLRGQGAALVRHRTLRWTDLPPPAPFPGRSPWREATVPLTALSTYLVLALGLVVAGARRLRTLD